MKAKSIIKRSLAFLLAIMTIMSVGLTNIIALSIEMVETRADVNCTIYYDNSKTKWSSPDVFIGGSNWSHAKSMTRISNTDLWYYTFSGYGNVTQIAFMDNTGSAWGDTDQSQGVSARITWASSRTGVLSVSNNLSNYQLITTASGNNDCALTRTSYTQFTSLNTLQSSVIQLVNGSSITTDSSAGTVAYSTYKLSTKSGSGSSTGTNSATAARTATVIMTATPASGYNFIGWAETESGSIVSSEKEYTYTCPGSATTYYARFKKAASTVTINTTTGGTVSPSGTKTVNSGDTLTITATPNDGYRFTGWTVNPTSAISYTSGNENSASITIELTDNVTLTPNFTLDKYTVTFNTGTGGTITTPSTNTTKVQVGQSISIEALADEANGFEFDYWSTNGNGAFANKDSASTTFTPAANNETVTANFKLKAYDVTVTQTGTPGIVEIGTDKVESASGEITVSHGVVNSYKVTAPAHHTIKSLTVSGETISDAVGKTSYSGSIICTGDSSILVEYLKDSYSITVDTNNDDYGTASATPNPVPHNEGVSLNATAKEGYIFLHWLDKDGKVASTENPYTISNITAASEYTAVFAAKRTVTVNLTGVAEGVAAATVEVEGSDGKNSDGKFNVVEGTEVTVKVSVPDNGAYYIGSFDGASISEQTTFTRSKTFTVEEDTILDVSIVARKKYTVTISNPDETQGTLVPVGDTTVYHGGSLIVRATPEDGYVISKWVVDGKETDNNNSEITLQNITSTRTVSIIWEESKEIKISGRAYPRAAGNVTITGFSGNYQQDAIAGKVYTFTVADTDTAVYEFTNWSFTGKYKLVEEEGNTIKNKTVKVIPLEDFTAVANFSQHHRWVYMYGNGYGNPPKAYYWGGSDTCSDFPGVSMQSTGTTNLYKVLVSVDTPNIIFSHKDNKEIQTSDLIIPTDGRNSYNLSSNIWKTFGYTIKIGSTEYVLTEQIDGTFVASATVTGDVTGEVYENSSTINVKKTTTDITAKSIVKFVFNPDNNSLTYTLREYPEKTFDVYVDNGASALVPGAKATDNTKKYTAVGQTTFDPDSEGYLEDRGFHYSDSHYDANYDDTGYRKYLVGDGMNIDIITTLDPAMASVYMIDGYIINSTEYVSAQKLNSTTYTTSYVFNESSERIVVVPVYQYSEDYIKANSLAEITLYVKKPADFTGDWKSKYMAAYIWYENSAGDEKYHFGVWPGQVMIPTTTGGGNYWKTKVVTTLPGGYNAAGITFSNYGGWEGKYNDTQGVMHPVTDTENVQVYDYYEFITLANKQSKNITFVLKNGNDDNRNSHTWNGSESYWETYKNIDNDNSDIFGEATTNTVTGLYIIRRAPIEHTTNPLNGHFYVDCDVYDATTKNKLGTFKSYELLQLTPENTKIGNVDFANYANKLVKIDYQCKIHKGYGSTNADSAPRYDGQWYDEVKQVTINVKVAQVGVDETDYTKYTVSTTNPGNEDTYGRAYVNEVGNPGGKIDRDTQLKLIAQPQSGFKFVGWYNAETKQLVSKQREYTEGTAVEGATFIAVFQPLKEGSFTINHNLYTGAGDGYTPLPLEGKGKLYIGVEEKNGDVIEKLSITDSVSFTAVENTTYVIKIATDPDLLDEFDAWYVQTKDKFGRTTYEEIGMDNFGEYGNLHDNGDTVVGRNDIVYLTFEHTVKKGEDNTIDIYSNIKKKDDKITLYYRYNDRSDVTRTVTVKYQLTDEYIAQYGREPHNGLIYELAPYVDDYYTNVTWVINKDKFNESAYILWATQEPPTYTVTVSTGSSNLVYPGNPYNTLVEVNASDLGAKSDKGYWIEINKDGTTGQVVAYGRYYGLRVTKDVTLKYIEDENIDFKVVLDAPVYTREQSGVVGEPGYVDQVLTDYMTSIHVPLFVGDVTANGDKITTTIFNDQAYVNANSPVTLETLVDMGYKFEYGVILEECRNADDMGKESDTTVLQKYVDKKSGFNDDNNKTRYGTTYNLTDKANITNKNRFLYTVKFNNTEANQNRNFNVYGYIKVTSNVKDAQPVYYFSELQTLNIKEYGNKVGNDQVGSDIVDE